MNEVARTGSYSEWGIIHPSGKLISGDDHPTAKIHGDLEGHASKQYKIPRDHFARYYTPDRHYDDHGYLALQTSNNKHSIGAAMKGFNKLPHSESNTVYHDHGLHSADTKYESGHKSKIYNHLKQLHSIAPG